MQLKGSDQKAEEQAVRAEELARLGARVRALRLKSGLTQQQLADHIDVHRVNFSKFERGRTDLGVSRIRRFG